MKNKTAKITLYHVWGTKHHTWQVEYARKIIAGSSNDSAYLGKCAGAMVADASRAAYTLGFRRFRVILDPSCGSI